MKVELQINFGYCKGRISGCGRINGIMRVVLAPNIPSLLRKVIKRYGVRQEEIALTFQPGTLKV